MDGHVTERPNPSHAISALANAGLGRAILAASAPQGRSASSRGVAMSAQNAQSGIREVFETMLNRRNGYEYEDLLACGRGELFGPGNCLLYTSDAADE